MTRAPFGKGATGPNPTDRARSGTKRNMVTDGAGLPLALVVDGANRQDGQRLCATLDGIVRPQPEPDQDHPQHRCLDAGSDSLVMRLLVRARGSLDHIRRRGEEKAEQFRLPGHRARRWVVERTHSWLHRSPRLLVRWEKNTENDLAFLPLACAPLLFATVFG